MAKSGFAEFIFDCVFFSLYVLFADTRTKPACHPKQPIAPDTLT